MASTEERLQELLDRKDADLEEAQCQISDLERQLRYGVDWMLHRRIEKADDALPVPRLELTLVHNSEYSSEQEVVMVLAERDGTRTRVPLAYSKTSGSGVRMEHCPTTGELPNQVLPSLVNDACYYSENTGLPAYVVLDDSHRYRVESLRPLRIVTV